MLVHCLQCLTAVLKLVGEASMHCSKPLEAMAFVQGLETRNFEAALITVSARQPG